MANISRTEIPLSKTRLAFLMLGSIAFTALGLWFLLMQNGLPFYRIVGVVAVICFGFTSSIMARRLKDDTPGLIIDEVGIDDNSSAVAPGLILWRDIIDVFVIEIGGRKLIMVEVNNPQEYIERQSHYLQKKNMEYNLKTYGSPLSITVDGLKCTFDKLYKLIRINLEENTA